MKYKHIPTGNIYEYRGKNKYVYHEGAAIPIEIVKSGSDWEEIKDKPDWTILSFKVRELKPDGILILNKKGTYSCMSWEYSLEFLLANPHNNSIYSVRREKDGEVFTIGDTLSNGKKIMRIISAIRGLLLCCGYAASEEIYLHNAKKAQPKEWEITNIRHNGSLVLMGTKGPERWKKLVTDEGTSYEIFSVKRLSDGVEFKIGDKLHEYTKTVTIKSFEIWGDYNVKIWLNEHDKFHTILGAQKKEKIFTTEDGVDLYGGETVWYACKKYGYKKNIVWKVVLFSPTNAQFIKARNEYLNLPQKGNSPTKDDTQFVVFSTEEAANKYVGKNSLLITEDGVPKYKGDNAYYVPFAVKSGKGTMALQPVAENDNIWQDTIGKIYHEYKKANEYYQSLIRKPLFKTEDGVDIYEGDRYFWVCEIKTDSGTQPFTIREGVCYEDIGAKEFDKMYKVHNFGTKKVADEYIVMNKPCLSLNDLLNYRMRIDSGLKEIVKNKLK